MILAMTAKTQPEALQRRATLSAAETPPVCADMKTESRPDDQ